MKNTRIERLKQSKRIKQATKLLTVGLLVCPLAIGTIKALADEAETTTLPTEQVAETPATIEEVAPVEETETSESVQPEVIEETQTEEPIPTESVEQSSETPVLENIEKEEPETFAVKASYQETFYTSSQTPFWNDDEYAGGGYTFTFSDGKQINVGFPSLDSDNFNWELIDSYHWTGGDVKGSGSSGQEISFNISEDVYKATIIVDTRHSRPSYNVSFAVDGNGSLSFTNTIQVPDGAFISSSVNGEYKLPVPTASPGYHFVGWYDGQWVNESSFFTIFSSDMILTAKFEAGDLDWSRYDGYTTTLLTHVNAKEAYEYFGYGAEWSRLNQHYIDWVAFKEENLNNPSFPQISISGQNSFNGIMANMTDNDRLHEMKMSMNDYLNSVKDVYQDSQSYTQESKEKFDSAYETLNQYQVNEWGVIEGDINDIFDAYQALKTAEQNLVKAEDPTLDELKAEWDKIFNECTSINGRIMDKVIGTEFEERYNQIFAVYDQCMLSESLINQVPTESQIIFYTNWLPKLKTALADFKQLEKDLNATQPETPTTEKLETSIQDAEAKLTESGYTEESMKALRQALQNAKDVLANANSTQAEIDEAQKALDLAIADLVKAEDPNSGNTGDKSSNGTGNSTTDPNNSNNGANNTNIQNNNNNSQTSNTATKPTGNQTNKDGLPQTGEQSTTNAMLAGLSLTMLSLLAWFKRKKV